MANEREMNDALEAMFNEVPGFIAASLVDLDSGMTLAVRSNRAEFDLAVASAYNSDPAVAPPTAKACPRTVRETSRFTPPAGCDFFRSFIFRSQAR